MPSQITFCNDIWHFAKTFYLCK